MNNNDSSRIHYRIKSANMPSVSCSCKKIIPYAAASLAASTMTAAVIAVCAICAKSRHFCKKHLFM